LVNQLLLRLAAPSDWKNVLVNYHTQLKGIEIIEYRSFLRVEEGIISRVLVLDCGQEDHAGSET